MATHLWYKKKALIYHAAIPGTLARLLPRSRGTQRGWGRAGGVGFRGALGQGWGALGRPVHGEQGKWHFQHRPDKATKSLVSDVIFKSQKLKTQVR